MTPKEFIHAYYQKKPIQELQGDSIKLVTVEHNGELYEGILQEHSWKETRVIGNITHIPTIVQIS